MTKLKSKNEVATRPAPTKSQASQIPAACGVGFSKSLHPARNQARPHHRDAAVIKWCDDRSNDDRHGTTFPVAETKNQNRPERP
jgi:hypothetical protein